MISETNTRAEARTAETAPHRTQLERHLSSLRFSIEATRSELVRGPMRKAERTILERSIDSLEARIDALEAGLAQVQRTAAPLRPCGYDAAARE